LRPAGLWAGLLVEMASAAYPDRCRAARPLTSTEAASIKPALCGGRMIFGFSFKIKAVRHFGMAFRRPTADGLPSVR
jgi:hypothetical protein